MVDNEIQDNEDKPIFYTNTLDDQLGLYEPAILDQNGKCAITQKEMLLAAKKFVLEAYRVEEENNRGFSFSEMREFMGDRELTSRIYTFLEIETTESEYTKISDRGWTRTNKLYPFLKRAIEEYYIKKDEESLMLNILVTHMYATDEINNLHFEGIAYTSKETHTKVLSLVQLLESVGL